MHSSPELSQNPLKIKQDDKFFSRLLSKENSTANPSFRVYYGNVSGAVPFTWEIQPGTPKHNKLSDTCIPPLTPPPSYYISNPNQHHDHQNKYHPTSNLLHNLLRNRSRRHRFSSFGSSFDDGNINMYSGGSPNSVMCFGMSNNKSSRSGGGSLYTIVIMKKAFLSIVGRRSG